LAKTDTLSSATLPRKSGVRLDSARIDFELGIRGVNQRTLAARAGIPEPTMSRARHGRPVSERTLRRITEALLGIPLMLGADMLIAAPEAKTVPASSLAETVPPTEVHGPGATPTER
jgi:transcriptional regulator with XRE-family HTH domain